METVFDDIAILVILQFDQEDIDEFHFGKDRWLFWLYEGIDGEPDIFDEMGAIAAQNVEQIDEQLGSLIPQFHLFG